MSDWLIWFAGYLLTGIALVLVVRFVAGIQSKRQRKDPELVADLLAVARSLEPKKTFQQRMAQGIAYAGILVIWPVMPFALAIDEFLKWRKKKQREEKPVAEIWPSEPNEGEGKTTLDNGCWPEHLKEIVDISRVPSEYMVFDPLGRAPNQPFGFLFTTWQGFVRKIEPGDTVHKFQVLKRQPYGLKGFRARRNISGFAIVRDSVVVEQFVY